MKHTFNYIVIVLSVFMLLCSCSSNTPFIKRNLQRCACDSLQNDTIMLVNQLTILNDKVFNVFDSIIDMKNTCVYKNENIWFSVSLSRINNEFFLFMFGLQHDERCWDCAIKRLDIQGVVRYRNHLFIVHSENDDTTLWTSQNLFTSTGIKDSLIVPYVNKTLFTAYLKDIKFYHEMNIWYIFKYDGQDFIPDEKRCGCIKYFPIYYRVKKNDSLDMIAKKFNVSPSMIIKLNDIPNPSDLSGFARKKIQIQ